MRYALIDTWTGQRVLDFSEDDLKTLRDLANAAINHHRPEPVPAVPDLRPSSSGDTGEDREERPHAGARLGLVGARRADPVTGRQLPLRRGERS